jgi:proteasome lid subunit RPN8/RPN11
VVAEPPVVAALRLPRELADALLVHGRAEEPNEACGILAGSLLTGQASAFHPARNADASPLRYTVHTQDLLRIVFAIEDAGEDLLAIFHTHTRTPAIPSASDLRAAGYPDAFYLLASLADPNASIEAALRAWRLAKGAFHEVPLRIG